MAKSPPLNKFPQVVGAVFGRLVRGVKGRMVTPKEAALQMRTLQLTRAEERRILEAGGLEVVEGGHNPNAHMAWGGLLLRGLSRLFKQGLIDLVEPTRPV